MTKNVIVQASATAAWSFVQAAREADKEQEGAWHQVHLSCNSSSTN